MSLILAYSIYDCYAGRNLKLCQICDIVVLVFHVFQQINLSYLDINYIFHLQLLKW